MQLENKHQLVQVDKWIKEVVPGLDSQQLIEVFDLGLSAVFNRAGINISMFALSTIFDRALYIGTEKFSFLSTIKVSSDGIDISEFARISHNLPEQELIDAFRYLMSEFIWILIRLTNGVLSESLFSELASVVYDPKIKHLKVKNGTKV